MGKKGDLLRSFWTKVKVPDGCWSWLGSLHDGGYGQMKDNLRDKQVYAHRLAYEIGGLMTKEHVIKALVSQGLTRAQAVELYPAAKGIYDILEPLPYEWRKKVVDQVRDRMPAVAH